MQEEDVIPDLLVTCVKTCALLFYQAEDGIRDRKSTRLHSSHLPISYAVFCLKKKDGHRERHERARRHRQLRRQQTGEGTRHTDAESTRPLRRKEHAAYQLEDQAHP